MSESTSSNDTPTDTTSVPTVPGPFQFGPVSEGEPLRKKCSGCNELADHIWYLQPVLSQFDPNPISTAHLHKRIVLCTNCGKVSVTK